MPIADFEHPLNGAYLRWRRADEHISELRGFVQAIKEAHEQVVTSDPQTHAPIHTEYREPDPEILQPQLRQASLRFGEAVYNMRAALDYLVYELARHDSGVEQEDTQFPIEDKPETFWNVRVNGKKGGVFLRGVNPAHVLKIEALQPYKRCLWTKRLRTLSNPDKHRKLHPVWGRFMPDLWNMFNVVEVPDPKPGADPSATISEVQVNLSITFYVALPDGGHVVHTLEELQKQVGRVLTEFEGEFGV